MRQLAPSDFKGLTVVDHDVQLESKQWVPATKHQNKFFSLCTRIIAGTPEQFKNASKGEVLFHWTYRFVRPDRTWKMKQMKLVKSGKRGTEGYSYQGDASTSVLRYRQTQNAYRGPPAHADTGTIKRGTIMKAMTKQFPRKIRFLRVQKTENGIYTLDLLRTVDSKEPQIVEAYVKRTFTTLVPGDVQRHNVVTATLGKRVYNKDTLQLKNGSMLGDKDFKVAHIYDPAKHPVLKQTHEGSRLLERAANLDTL